MIRRISLFIKVRMTGDEKWHMQQIMSCANYRVSQKSRTIQVSTENAFIDYSHNRCSNCAPTAMKQASNLFHSLERFIADFRALK